MNDSRLPRKPAPGKRIGRSRETPIIPRCASRNFKGGTTSGRFASRINIVPFACVGVTRLNGFGSGRTTSSRICFRERNNCHRQRPAHRGQAALHAGRISRGAKAFAPQRGRGAQRRGGRTIRISQTPASRRRSFGDREDRRGGLVFSIQYSRVRDWKLKTEY